VENVDALVFEQALIGRRGRRPAHA
jgi:hypothetical protein